MPILTLTAAAASTYAGLVLFFLSVFRLLQPIPANVPRGLVAALFG